MSKFLSAYKAKNPPSSGIPYHKLNEPLAISAYPGKLGIELEIEGRNLINGGHLDGLTGEKSKATWHRKEDGSLRNGFEYVLSRPCEVDEVRPLVAGLFQRMVDARATINNSNRCSTHVHVNISGKKISELTSVLGLWCVFENALIAWNGEARTTNHFCLSTKDEDGFIQAWTQFLRSGAVPQQGAGLKYTALNILPIWTQGSIEFRCGLAPDTADAVISWALFLNALVDYAAKKYPNPQHIAYDISERGATEILRDICKEYSLEEQFFLDVVAIYGDNFNIRCVENFRSAQPFILGLPWDEWQDDINAAFVPNPFEKKAKLPRGRG